jgi:hypothetical protein
MFAHFLKEQMPGFFAALSRTSARQSFAFNGSVALLSVTSVHPSAMPSF